MGRVDPRFLDGRPGGRAVLGCAPLHNPEMSAPLSASLAAIPRVLIADSDMDNRVLYRDSFTFAGWSVSEAHDGREALVQAFITRPWIVVTELRLPIIDGASLCEILREDGVTASVRILVITSETRDAELDRARRAGADEVLLKPCAPDRVVAEARRMARTRFIAAAPALPSPPGHRTSLAKAHHRFETTSPDQPPLPLVCPICTDPLRYERTFIGGVSRRHPERWDYFSCPKCGQFQYRFRTRKLRQLT